MAKILVKKEELKKRLLKEEMQQFLEDKYEAFVLITCSEADEKGQMQVDMKYKGDEDLVSYLLQGGSQVFENHEEDIKKDSL